MMSLRSLASLFRKSDRRPPPSRGDRRRTRPGCETLENRQVLTTFTPTVAAALDNVLAKELAPTLLTVFVLDAEKHGSATAVSDMKSITSTQNLIHTYANSSNSTLSTLAKTPNAMNGLGNAIRYDMVQDAIELVNYARAHNTTTPKISTSNGVLAWPTPATINSMNATNESLETTGFGEAATPYDLDDDPGY